MAGEEWIAGEKNDISISRARAHMHFTFYRLTWSALGMADKLVAENPTMGNYQTTFQVGSKVCGASLPV